MCPNLNFSTLKVVYFWQCLHRTKCVFTKMDYLQSVVITTISHYSSNKYLTLCTFFFRNLDEINTMIMTLILILSFLKTIWIRDVGETKSIPPLPIFNIYITTPTLRPCFPS